MTVDIAAQQAALLQAAALGLAAGLLYDLFRILRCRVRLPLLGPALDLLFWLVLTGVLFLWSQWAWGGPVRLYGVVFLFLGGVIYFRLFSRWMLFLGYRIADLTTFLLGILALPLFALNRLFKKLKKLAKNIFLSSGKWYRINQITQEMESTARRRADRASLLTKLVITVLLIYMATSLLDLWGQIQSAQSQREELAIQVEQQRLANQELRDAIENSDDPDTLERVAREKGYVKQGETLYIDVAG